MIKAILFDMDGVLFDTERLYRAVMRKAMAEQNAVMSDEVFARMLGSNETESMRIMREAYPCVDYTRLTGRRIGRARQYIRRFGVPVKKGVPGVLHDLVSQNYQIGLATSTERDETDYLLARSGLSGLFGAEVCGKEAARGKPAPDSYLLCAKKLGVHPNECAGVEDSLNGLKALHAAGIYAVMIPDIMSYSDVFRPYADAVIDDLTGLSDVINRIQCL